MRKVLKIPMRLILLIGLFAILRLLLFPAVPSQTPYPSALSNPAVVSPEAAGCPDKSCSHGLECVASTGYKCIRFNGKGCTASPC